MKKICFITPGFEISNNVVSFATPSTSIATQSVVMTPELRRLVMKEIDGADDFIEVTHYDDGLMAWKISHHLWTTVVIVPRFVATALRNLLND